MAVTEIPSVQLSGATLRLLQLLHISWTFSSEVPPRAIGSGGNDRNGKHGEDSEPASWASV
jgi:hypothetical protein